VSGCQCHTIFVMLLFVIHMVWTLADVKANLIPRGFVGPLLPYFLDSKNPHQPMNIYRSALENASVGALNAKFIKENAHLVKPLSTSPRSWADSLVRKYQRGNLQDWVKKGISQTGGWGKVGSDLRVGQLFVPVGRRLKNATRKWIPRKMYDAGLRAKALATVARKMRQNFRPWLLTGVRKGKWMYPGVNYIGPGNKLNEGKPVSYHDRLAYVHDHQYDYLQRKGVNPYFTFNEADRQMLRNVDTRNDQGMAEWLGMNAKRVFKSDRTSVPNIPSWESKYGNVTSEVSRPRRKAWRR